MKKTILWILGAIGFIILIIAAAWFYKFNILEDDIYIERESGVVVKANDIIEVSTSIIPISSIVNAIGWDYVYSYPIIPAGVSPHGFDLSAKDLVTVKQSDIVFLIGLDQIDGFLKKPLENKKYIELAQGIELLEASAHKHDEHEDKDEDEHSVDAHVWLGKENIIMIAETIRDELSLILPEHADIFSENTEIFRTELEAIYATFIEENSDKTAKEFIVFHDAYNYLMESVWVNPDLKIPFSKNILHESGTAHIVELIEEIELHGLQNIFSEPQFSDWNLQSFAQQYNLTVSTLDPIGTDSSASGYLENLKTNLDNLGLIYE